MTEIAGVAEPVGAVRPLVVRFGAIGDLIQLTSMLEQLHRTWRRPVDLLTGSAVAELVVRGLPHVGEVLAIGSRSTPYWCSPRQWRAVRTLRRAPAGPAWVIDHRPRAVRTLRRLLERAGTDPALVRDSEAVPRAPLEHTLDYQHRLAREMPVIPPDAPGGGLAGPPPPRLAVTPEEVDDCRSWLARRGLGDAPMVVVQTSSRNLKRGRWPRDRWRRAGEGILSALPDARLVLTGTPAEGDEVRSLVSELGDPRLVDATSDLPLRRLFALLTLAHSCVSLDTGPAHAAAALGCPVVVLTGAADPRRCQPRPDRAPVEVVASIPREEWPDDPHEWRRRNRMEQIGVDDVLEAWHRATAADPAAATATTTST